MINGKVVCKDGNIYFRVYKFENDNVLLGQVALFEEHYKKSVSIITYGNIEQKHLHMFNQNADSYATYDDYNFEIGDRFLYTEERANVKRDDDTRLKNAGTNWNQSEIAGLCKFAQDGQSVKQIAEALKRTTSEVDKKINELKASNKLIIVPKPVKEKVVKEKIQNVKIQKPKKHNGYIVLRKRTSTDDNGFLVIVDKNTDKIRYSLGVDIEEVLFKSFFDVEKQRFNNGFKESTALNHLIEKAFSRQGFFWNLNKDTLWNFNLDDIQVILGVTRLAAYQARLKFLEKNKGFIVPKASEFIMNEPYDKEKYVFTYEGGVKPEPIQKVIPNPVTVSTEEKEVVQTPVAVTPHTQEEQKIEPPIQQPAVDIQQQQPIQPADINNLATYIDLINNLKDKPKKINLPGGIVLEY